MSVLENVMLGRHTRSKAGFGAAMLNLPWTWREEDSIEEKSRAILAYLTIDDVAILRVSEVAYVTQLRGVGAHLDVLVARTDEAPRRLRLIPSEAL